MSIYDASEEGVTPASPSASRQILYPKVGAWYKKDSAGNERRIIEADAGGHIPIADLPAAVVGALNYQGTWNATTNTPTLVSGVGTKGFYYVVNVAGTTNIDGHAVWTVGDWIVFNGTTWDIVQGNITSAEVITALGFTPANVAGNLSQFATGGAIAPASIHGVVVDATTNKPVTAALLNGGTLPASVTDLTTSGILQVGGTSAGQWYISKNTIGNAYLSLASGSSAIQVLLGAEDNIPVYIRSNATNILGVTGTGASVTGAISSTGNGTFNTAGGNQLGLRISDYTAGGVAAIYNAANTNNSGNFCFASGTTQTYINGSVGVHLSVNGSPIIDLTAGNTAVTGAISATGAISSLSNGEMINIKYASDVGSALLAWKNSAGTTLWGIGGGIVTAQDELAIIHGTIASHTVPFRIDNTDLLHLSNGLAVTGAISATTTIKTGGYTVATLPTGATGDRAYVTDATAPTFLGTLTGGGAVVTPVFFNGTAWVAG